VTSSPQNPAQKNVGSGDYIVRHGDCMLSIATDHGFFWKTLWTLPENSELKQTRRDPNLLLAGDRVTIIDKRPDPKPGQTGRRHRFRLKAVPAQLRLRVLKAGQPRANESYALEIDGDSWSGTLDADGLLVHNIPPNASKGRVFVGRERDLYRLLLGHLDPIDTNTGVQQRLNNLAYPCGQVDGIIGPKTLAALRDFRKDNNLSPAEIPSLDDPTRTTLKQVHGR
jgi:hypothetical protein